MIQLATVFSGIGGVEQALVRLGLSHRVVFACDNGDVELDLLGGDDLAEYTRLKKLRSKKQLKNAADIERLARLGEKEQMQAEAIRAFVKGMRGRKRKKEYIDRLYAERSRQTNFVRRSYLANYAIDPDDFHLDVRFLDGRDYAGAGIDLLAGGSPCQSFSTVGARCGLEDTRGTLFYEFARLVLETRPKAFIFENVRGLATHDDGATLDTMLQVLSQLDYDVAPPQVLNAADFGIPQTRRRLFIVGIRKDLGAAPFEYPSSEPLRYTMQDFLEDNCAYGNFGFVKSTGALKLRRGGGAPDPKFNLTPAVQRYVLAGGTGNFKTSTETDLPVARTLMKMMTQHHRAGVDNYITVSRQPLQLRQLSDREALRLMGFPDSFRIAVSSMQMLRQAGNSMVVDVMMKLVQQIIKTGALR